MEKYEKEEFFAKWGIYEGKEKVTINNYRTTNRGNMMGIIKAFYNQKKHKIKWIEIKELKTTRYEYPKDNICDRGWGSSK